MLKQTLALCALSLIPMFAQADVTYRIAGSEIRVNEIGIKVNNEIVTPYCNQTRQAVIGASSEKTEVSLEGACIVVNQSEYSRFLVGWGTMETNVRFCPDVVVRDGKAIAVTNELAVARALDKVLCDGQGFIARSLKASY